MQYKNLITYSTTLTATLFASCLAAVPVGAVTPFFYDLLPQNDRLDVVMLDTSSVRVFEQSRRIGERKSFPVIGSPIPEPDAMPTQTQNPVQQPEVIQANSIQSELIQPQTVESPAPIENDTKTRKTALTESESGFFDSHLTIMDASAEFSVDQLAAQVLNAIAGHGAEIQTNCSGERCGAPEVWTDRFGLYAAGAIDSQRYYRAMLPARVKGSGVIAAQIYELYISRLGCCVRIALIQSQPSALQYQVSGDGTIDAASPGSTQSIYFGPGSSTLSQANQTLLDAFGDSGARCGAGFRIAIEGRADSVGSRDLNRTLSEERASSVSTYLLRQGLTEDCLFELALGEDSPDAASLSEQRSVRLRWLPAGWQPALSEPDPASENVLRTAQVSH